MGTWAIDAFGNDTANDWAYELLERDDLSLLEETLDKVIEDIDDYLEAPDADEAIAAIEVMTRLQGNGGEHSAYTEEVDEWVKKIKLKPDVALIAKAKKVIDRILSADSELLELWQESDDFEEWKTYLENLKVRIAK